MAKFLSRSYPVRFLNGGCFFNKGNMRHGTRIIDSHELIIVRRGGLGMFEGALSFDLGPNQFLHLHRGRKHGGTKDYSADLSFYWLHFKWRKRPLAISKTGLLARPSIAADIASRLLDEQDRTDAPEGSCDLLMQLLLLECGVPHAQETQIDRSGLADRAKQFIRTHYQQPIGAREVAEYCGCHPDHLGKLFKTRFKQTLSEAVLVERIRKAKSLLRDGSLNIDELAVTCGFSEAHYFRRCFKKVTGSSPSHWRALHQRMNVNIE